MKWLVLVLMLGVLPVAYGMTHLLGWPANAQPVVLQAKTCDDSGGAIFGIVYSDGSVRTVTIDCSPGIKVTVEEDE